MKIYMFNTWFGDCFQIENDTSNLIIDFGIHKSSKLGNGLKRDDIHKDIAKEIISYTKKPNLLITHYHEDHYSGLLYMMNESITNPGYVNVFKNVYIPDVWGIPESTKIVALHLLEDLLRGCKLDKRKCTLLEFVKFLCGNVCNIVFTHRGTKVEDELYIALWPDSNELGIAANSLINDLRLAGYSFYNSLIEIAKDLSELMLERVRENLQNRTVQGLERYIRRLAGIEERLNMLFNNEMIREMASENSDDETESDILTYLNSFKNKISIVFHNIENDANKNLLFTGDIEAKYMNIIAMNYDGNTLCNMHTKYCYIKIPHHGTQGSGSTVHYYNFYSYQPKVYMIPNGECTKNPAYQIDSEYANVGIYTTSKQAKMYCSNCNWCQNNPGKTRISCLCSIHDLIFPKGKIIVSP